ncbi:MAG TPA: 3,4-dihydroxy-2-butanone-4-phosphate synthase [Candidatus Thermoplasmatota archaeon]|nr:3,4-dihydroxy-2-butanone-4-phosphate synthase [Candidatus Thermoplasmatota archaeon]
MTDSSARRLATAYDRLAQGGFVLVYDADGREEEVDLFVAAERATPAAVETLRRDAGGLVFLAVDAGVGARLGLPFLHDLFRDAAAKHPVLAKLIPNDLRYDTRSSFSLTINHRGTFTGITDNDRSLTITEFGRLAARAPALAPEEAQAAFGAAFRAPGHVHLCVGAPRPFVDRSGHTEIAVALARVAGVTPVLAGAEMLDRGVALSRSKAEAWARAHDTVVVTGEEIAAAYAKLHEQARPVVQR